MKRFEVGKLYRFTGHPMFLKEGESPMDFPGAMRSLKTDIEMKNWIDGKPRRCIYVDPVRGVAASFENIIVLGGVKWTYPRNYRCYLDMDMFEEVPE